jgi:hypothetical protein
MRWTRWPPVRHLVHLASSSWALILSPGSEALLWLERAEDSGHGNHWASSQAEWGSGRLATRSSAAAARSTASSLMAEVALLLRLAPSLLVPEPGLLLPAGQCDGDGLRGS